MMPPSCKDDAKRLNPLIRGDVWNVLNISHLLVTLLRRTRVVGSVAEHSSGSHVYLRIQQIFNISSCSTDVSI